MGENNRPDFFGLIPASIFGLADLHRQAERGGASTFRMAQKYSQAPPKQSSHPIRQLEQRLCDEWYKHPGQPQARCSALCPNQIGLDIGIKANHTAISAA